MISVEDFNKIKQMIETKLISSKDHSRELGELRKDIIDISLVLSELTTSVEKLTQELEKLKTSSKKSPKVLNEETNK